MDDIIIYTTDDGRSRVSLYANDGTVWMTQAQMCELFDVGKSSISEHIKGVFADKELVPEAVVRKFRTTASDGKTYLVTFYSLEVVLAVGFRVRSPRGTQFRQWANSSLHEYLQKGFLMDDERLKNPDGRPDYFDELLARIRDIRASEKRFYQKLRDLFKLSSDYHATKADTQNFFAETQNKLLYGVTGKTAAELITSRADAAAPNMALTSWAGDRVRKGDIYIAKNYLTADEIDSLNRLVSLFLESAEFRVKMRKTLTLTFWRQSTDKLLEDHDVPLLRSRGTVSNAEMRKIVTERYEEFADRRKKYEAEQADADDLEELERTIKTLTPSK